MIFKVVPDAEIDWHDVWLGAVVTALLFTLGKYLIGIYLSNAGVGSTYGAAGSLVVLLLWIYYSAQIFFFGAEFTQVYANRFGSKIVHGNQVLMEELDIRKQVENSGRTGSRQTVNGEKEAMVSDHDKLAISHREQELEPLPQMQPSLLAFSTLLATLVGFLAGLLFFRGGHQHEGHGGGEGPVVEVELAEYQRRLAGKLSDCSQKLLKSNEVVILESILLKEDIHVARV